MRIKLTIAYDGSAFYGYQSQKHTKETVADAFYELFESLNIETKIHASGRTDTGVHATGQVIHFDLPDYWHDTQKLRYLMNNKLPKSIRVTRFEIAAPDFHARYSAKRRRYRYLLSTQTPSPFASRYIHFIDSVDITKLREALALFEGSHDFALFQKQGASVKTTTRTIYKTLVYEHQGTIVLRVDANGFLRSQIRMIVHALLAYANGKLSLEALKEQIDGKQKHSSRLAPPNGLYLTHIFYN